MPFHLTATEKPLHIEGKNQTPNQANKPISIKPQNLTMGIVMKAKTGGQKEWR